MDTSNRDKDLTENNNDIYSYREDDDLDYELLHQILDSLTEKLNDQLSENVSFTPVVHEFQDLTSYAPLQPSEGSITEASQVTLSLIEKLLKQLAPSISLDSTSGITICYECIDASCQHVTDEMLTGCTHVPQIPNIPCFNCIKSYPTQYNSNLLLLWDDRELSQFGLWSQNMDVAYGMSN